MNAPVPNNGAPSHPGMTGEQASDAGQAMLSSARAQKDQIAQGFLAEREAVLKTVAEQQANIPKPTELGGLTTAQATAAAQAEGYSPEEIEAALRIMHANTGLGDAAPQAAPTPPVPPQTAPSHAPQDSAIQEIILHLQVMIAAEVSVQLRAHGLIADSTRVQSAAQNTAQNTAQENQQNSEETPSQSGP